MTHFVLTHSEAPRIQTYAPEEEHSQVVDLRDHLVSGGKKKQNQNEHQWFAVLST